MKAIIFDFFDVLALRGTDSFRLTYFPDDLEKNRQVKQLQADRELGKIDFEHFVSKVAAVGGVNRQIVLRHIENYQPNVQLLKYIREQLKPKYKIGMIPNTTSDWLLRILGSANLALFDNIVLTPKPAYTEPETKIYQLAAHNLGVKEKECVYVGYLPSNCQAAEATGMKSIWYWGFKQIEEEFGRGL
jgi:HAD superfamily hydrolase (TIGR01509 family)